MVKKGVVWWLKNESSYMVTSDGMVVWLTEDISNIAISVGVVVLLKILEASYIATLNVSKPS